MNSGHPTKSILWIPSRLVNSGPEAFDYQNPGRIDFSSVALVELDDLWEDQAIETINSLPTSTG